MSVCLNRRSFLLATATAALPASLTGCGLLLHPERCGQEGGAIDWRIAALDGLGMLLFFVPGVIAFAVDFHQGTIFLPEGASALEAGRSSLISVRVPRKELSQQRIERIVSAHADQPVELQSGACRTTPLQSIESFWISHDRLLRRTLDSQPPRPGTDSTEV